MLNEEHEKKGLAIALTHFIFYNEEGDDSLKHTVSGDETMTFHKFRVKITAIIMVTHISASQSESKTDTFKTPDHGKYVLGLTECLRSLENFPAQSRTNSMEYCEPML